MYICIKRTGGYGLHAVACAVVALERKKQSDSEEKIAALKESIAALKNK